MVSTDDIGSRAMPASVLVVIAAIGACNEPARDGTNDGARTTDAVAIAPATMARVGTVADRYQSYNVEMLEVTGGKFWRPYDSKLDSLLAAPPKAAAKSEGDTPAGMNPDLQRYRPPIDLTNPRLRKLAAALGPTYVRVSGTWANTTYFPPSGQAPKTPPAGFNGVLTHEQWKGVVDFAKAVNAEIVTSVATSPGVRDATGAWTPDQPRRLFAYTKSIGGRIEGEHVVTDRVVVAPETITFLAIPSANNQSCR